MSNNRQLKSPNAISFYFTWLMLHMVNVTF